MSSNTIEVKAMSKEEAIKRALKILEAKEENIVKVIEKQKSKSFLGLFTKEGIYSIEIDKDKKIDIKKENKDTAVHPKNDIEKDKKKDISKDMKKEKIIEKNETATEKENAPENMEMKEDISIGIQNKAQEILEKMGLNLIVKVSRVNDRTYLVDLYGEDNGIIIGKKGKTLNSFEYLLNSIFKGSRIEVDVEGFKEKRNETLRELGRKMADKVIRTGKTIRLNPMPPRERKIIHEILNKYPKLDTYSEGKDPKRYIVIKKRR